MFRQELEKLEQQSLLRKMRNVESAQGPRIILNGKGAINLCSNNYLGIANHPLLKKSAIEAIESYGIGTSGSRLISGTTVLHSELEKRIAEFKGTAAGLVFNSGYTASVGIISALVSRGDIIFSDRLNHASIVDGCLLSGAEFKRYPHCDIAGLEEMLETQRPRCPDAQRPRGPDAQTPRSPDAQTPRCPDIQSGKLGTWASGKPKRKRLIVTDTVFSMDGDIAPLPKLVELAKKYDCMLMVDEAHATGILGKNGRGAVEHFGLEKEFSQENFIQMGTLSKALGGFGAYVAGSKDLIDYIMNKSRAFIYTTALPVSTIAAAIAALGIVRDQPQLRKQLFDNVRFFKEGLEKIGVDTMKSQTQIIPILIKDSQRATEISNRLLEKGVFIQAIRPPTVPKGTARLRVSLMATHRKEDLEEALEKMKKFFPSFLLPYGEKKKMRGQVAIPHPLTLTP
jgi:glycine C-acetyltransferase